MIAASDMRRFVREGARLLAAEKDLAEFELYCSSAEQFVMRINYTSEIPCNGVEEGKSLGADGFAVRIVPRRNPHEIGIGIGAGDLGQEPLRAALARARETMVADPDFAGLPSRPRTIAAVPRAASGLMKLDGSILVSTAWRIIEGAVAALDNPPNSDSTPGVVIGGDLTVTRDRMALASSHFSDIRLDESAWFSSSVTALIETLDAKGTASAIGQSIAEMRAKVPGLGRQAVASALGLAGGERPQAGRYKVVFGPQPVAEILCYMVVPSLTTGAFHAASSAYHGRFGEVVMDRRLSLRDDPLSPFGAIRRRVTCEGLSARRSELIRNGRLSGLLSTVYDSHRLATDNHRAEKLGPHAPPTPRFAASSGYRLGEGGVRRYDSTPGAAPTNVILRATGGVSERELLEAVGDGIYIGRVWYTYPINGQRAGDFTCTISGDSYLIRNGRLAGAIAPNCLRINANLKDVFDAPIECGRTVSPALVWGSPEAFYVPAIAARAIDLSRIGE